MKLLQTWAKAPFLADADVLIMSECLPYIYPAVVENFSKNREVLTVCPEAEQSAIIYGKLASMMRTTMPRVITVLTVECSPHCYTLHAAVNEAIYLTDLDIPVGHLVCLNGEVIEVSDEAVRMARYLHLVERSVKNDPFIRQRLAELSLEQQADDRRGKGGREYDLDRKGSE